MRNCPWPGCLKRIDPQFFLCPPHWRELPLTAQMTVSAAYRRYLRARDRDDLPALTKAAELLREIQEITLRQHAPGYSGGGKLSG